MSLRYRLMFDGVFNHVSAASRLFQEFLNGNPNFSDFFVRFSTREQVSEDHLRLILRPRVTDLLTGFNTIGGRQYVWTTFGPDQIDLNFKNERVLARVVEILLYYVRRGADIIRLDAITYLWTELGTTCAHLQQTHVVVQLLRSILEIVAPRVALVTEANVTHEELVTYFGNGRNEAHMEEDVDLQVDRFIASRAIALVLQGVPGAYLPSLLGAQNDLDSALESGEPRSINRKSYDENALVDKLRDRSSSTYKVATRFRELTEKRIATPAFHPNGPQRVLMRHPAVFSLVRTSPDGRQRVLALTNVSREAQEATFSETELGTSARTLRDILSGRTLESYSGTVRARLEPYESLWLTPA